MKSRFLATVLAGSLVLAACSSSDDDEPVATTDDTAEEAAAEEPAEEATEEPAEAPAASPTSSADIADSALGEILVGDGGLSLYGFTNDVDGVSACYGQCAEAWPPLIVDAEWAVGAGLDPGGFDTATRDDGQLQLVAGDWPLYYFAGDAVPGDVNGQGVNDVWFVVDPTGTLISTPAAAAVPAESGAAPVTVGATSLGDALVDDAGLTLYGFLNDTDGVSNCTDACADAWPPAFVDGPDLPAGLDAAVFSVIERADGTHQLQAGSWPLYTFSGDAASGDVNGQGLNDVWFVAAPDGSLING